MRGNYIHITAGTNFTAGFYRVVTFNSTTSVVLDRNPTTGASASAGTGRLGGAVASEATIATVVVPGNTVHLVGTAFTTAAALAFSVDGTDGNPITYIGHAAARGDNGQALITSTNAAATQVIEITGAGSIVRGITTDGAGLSARGIRANDYGIVLDNCEGKNCTQHGIYVTASALKAMVKRCRATGNGSGSTHSGFACEGEVGTFDRCESRGNSGYGFYGILGTPRWLYCEADGNSLSGFYVGGNNDSVEMLSCTAYGNTQDGLRVESASLIGGLVRNNIFAANGGYGVKSVTTDYSANANLAVIFETNAFYGNTSGARSLMPTGADDITLTEDPFVNAASRDFSLNMVEGGGLELRGAGTPGEIGLRSDPSPSVGYNDVGAVPSGGSTSSSTGLGTMRSLWRELTGEFDQDVVQDATVDAYLQRGLEELNRLVRYHYDDDATSITLVAGTQDYALPAACNELVFVFWRGQPLLKSDVEEWRRQGVPWRQQSGEPSEWAFYGDKLVLYPIPTGEAVAADPNPVLRYGSNPPDIGTAGPEQLRSQDYPIPVYHAVALWSASFPDSASAQMRLGFYEPLFDKEAGKVGAYYEARGVSR